MKRLAVVALLALASFGFVPSHQAPYRVVFCHIPLRWRNETLPDYSKGGFDHFSERSRTRGMIRWSRGRRS